MHNRLPKNTQNINNSQVKTAAFSINSSYYDVKY